MSYGPHTHNPWEHDESEPEHDNGEFQCPCGDEHCRGYDDDPALIKIGRTFYASDCAMANHHPEVIRSREMDAIWERSRR